MYKLHTILCLAAILYSHIAQSEPLQVRNSMQGYAYVNAGIGEEESAQVKRIAKNFTLNLWLSEGVVGRWVQGANINIYDESSNLMFRIVDAKPITLVNLPTGTYTILANNQGNKLRHKVMLTTGESQKVILNWKDFVDEDVPLDGEGN